MLRTVLLVLAGLGAGFAVALWMQPDAAPPLGADAASTADRPISSGFGAVDSSRLEDLEAALEAEIDERAALEQRVIDLGAQLEELRAGAAGAPARPVDRRADANADPGDTVREAVVNALPPAARARFRGGPPTPEQELERLVAAGFAPDRAAWIQKRNEELALQMMQARYEARRDGKSIEEVESGLVTLRSELGDQDYEKYLTAQGRPTRVGVFNVMAGSAAEKAGLRAGDEIVGYGGERVFDVGELNRLTYEGQPGASVTVDVLRDGQNLQLVVPRGPIGIGGGPAFRRGP